MEDIHILRALDTLSKYINESGVTLSFTENDTNYRCVSTGDPNLPFKIHSGNCIGFIPTGEKVYGGYGSIDGPSCEHCYKLFRSHKDKRTHIMDTVNSIESGCYLNDHDTVNAKMIAALPRISVDKLAVDLLKFYYASEDSNISTEHKKYFNFNFNNVTTKCDNKTTNYHTSNKSNCKHYYTQFNNPKTINYSDINDESLNLFNLHSHEYLQKFNEMNSVNNKINFAHIDSKANTQQLSAEKDSNDIHNSPKNTRISGNNKFDCSTGKLQLLNSIFLKIEKDASSYSNAPSISVTNSNYRDNITPKCSHNNNGDVALPKNTTNNNDPEVLFLFPGGLNEMCEHISDLFHTILNEINDDKNKYNLSSYELHRLSILSDIVTRTAQDLTGKRPTKPMSVATLEESVSLFVQLGLKRYIKIREIFPMASVTQVRKIITHFNSNLNNINFATQNY
jgi:hypothetical protein